MKQCVWEEGVGLWHSKKIKSKELDDQWDRVGWGDEDSEVESEVSGSLEGAQEEQEQMWGNRLNTLCTSL